ncbi:hypothetical protein [Thauera butanivorans]|uniref:hypothetical protein n=1 Tax=Thauera butanivorans TaxID=86174 RepID=UPI000838F4AC|nr:hypothetical protein [Thauera butanivorans]
MSVINRRASLLAKQAEALYKARLTEVALQALARAERVTEDWCADQLPEIDSDMRQLFDLVDAEWRDVEPF